MLFATFLTLLIASVSTEGVFISPASSQGSKCLQVRDFDNIKNGNAVQISDCSDFVAPSQTWEINLGATFVRLDPLVDLSHNFCMDVVNFHSGHPVVVWECNDKAQQVWGYGSRLLKPLNNTDLCLEVPDSSMEIGVQVRTATCNGGKNQFWDLG